MPLGGINERGKGAEGDGGKKGERRRGVIAVVVEVVAISNVKIIPEQT